MAHLDTLDVVEGFGTCGRLLLLIWPLRLYGRWLHDLEQLCLAWAGAIAHWLLKFVGTFFIYSGRSQLHP